MSRQIVCRDVAWRDLARLHQASEVDAGRETHPLQHEHEILGDDVAARARSKGAATEARYRGIETADPRLETGDSIGKACAEPVVQMQPQCQLRSDLAPDGLHDLPNQFRGGVTNGVGKADLVGTGFGKGARNPAHRSFADLAFQRAAEGG